MKNQEATERLFSQWMTSLAEVLAQKTGERPRIERMDRAAEPSFLDELTWQAYGSSGSDEPSVWIGAPADAVDAIGKSLSHLGRALGLSFREGAAVSGAPEDLPTAAIEVRFADAKSWRLNCTVNPDFLKAIPAKDTTPETLPLLLDLELPVSVCFGRVQMPFQAAMKLSNGSIIELNRSVDDPDRKSVV